MDAGMFGHPATKENVKILELRGNTIIGPEAGHLASGLIAKGRMSEPDTILACIRYQLSRGNFLDGKKIVVTAGGTQEIIDPVRHITNRSSGKQGYALAQASLNAGADVTLISAPTNLEQPYGANFIPVRTALEMEQAVLSACQDAYALLMAAAVADFRPDQIQNHKIKKNRTSLQLNLTRTSDILTSVKSQRQNTGFPKIMIGFAAETQNVYKNAINKLQSKGLDLIVANDVSANDAGFEVDTNRVTLFWPNGEREDLPIQTKVEIANKLIQKLAII
jgi:phosphopantothenoylcysteine decarboxylase/phosphopantothenate--cysteine ligase